MKNFVILFLILNTITYATGKESTNEKVEVQTNNAKRSIKKSANRISETFCAKSDLKCAAEKSKNGMIEVKDATVDVFKKVKNKID
jgi:hypothetical protein